MKDHNHSTQAQVRSPLDHLSTEELELFWWTATFITDSNDALTDLLFRAGVLP